MAQAWGALNGSGPQEIYINVNREAQDYGGNWSRFRIEVKYLAKNYGSWINQDAWWNADAGGIGWSGTFRVGSPGTSDITLLDTTFIKYHDGNGYLGGFNNTANMGVPHDRIGSGGVGVWEGDSPRIPKTPQAPNGLRVDAIMPTSFGVWYNRGDNMGAGIDQDHALWRRVSDGVDVWNDYGPSGYTNPAGAGLPNLLTPATEYDVFIRSHNSQGWGGFSSPVRARTLSGAYVSLNGSWVPVPVYASNGSSWQTPDLYGSVSGAWQRPV